MYNQYSAKKTNFAKIYLPFLNAYLFGLIKNALLLAQKLFVQKPSHLGILT